MFCNRLLVVCLYIFSLEVVLGTQFNTSNSPTSLTAFYCDMCCLTPTDKMCNQHTMCIYSAHGHGPMCHGYRNMRLTQKEKQEVLHAHNQLRNYVALGLETRGASGPQPRAADMREMEWDEELEAIAARWADQCIPGKDVCRDVARFPVGQNTAEGSFTALNLTNHVVTWYTEVLAFDAAMIKNYQPAARGLPEYSSYTQLMWADTYTLGCARVMYNTDSTLLYYKEHLTCNYGPAGNVAHNQVYTVGDACSACPKGLRCASPRYDGLCYHANRARLDEQCLLKEGGCDTNNKLRVEETRLVDAHRDLQEFSSSQRLVAASSFVTIFIGIAINIRALSYCKSGGLLT